MKRFLKLNALILLGGMSLTAITPATLVYASNVQTESVGRATALNDVDPLTQIKYDCKDLGFVLSYNKCINGELHELERLSIYNSPELDPSSLTSEPVAKINNDMVIEDGESVAAHKAVLTNNTNQDQNLTTAAFGYKQTDSVTTQTTHSAGGSLTTSAEMKFPFVSGSMSMEVRYDFGHTKAVTSSIEKNWEVPSQKLLVPAGHTYQLEWVLKMGTASGTTDLDSMVSAEIPFKKLPWDGGWDTTKTEKYSIGDAISEQERLVSILGDSAYTWEVRNTWQRIDSTTALKKLTTSKYKAKIGTELLMNVVDVTNGSRDVVDSIPMDIVPQVD
ncbi:MULTISPECIES: ETX/MTX2 family pore-forming toxin [unclassified Enterococcus]|uniref:ETX/MTX2 family pore-forming toxin n=1 Tax=unclassified Enterococcus TaxID=2608891 RepID=UPI0028FD14A5|nr:MULTISPECIES: ETX/MTX2 family pore-forming toxin [unclassified Enterococcus]MDU0320654.1 ETX/MTX2 family pore-forming toxin [Enterococcus sp. 2STP]MDU0333228.1 ETX/MTX2 family pore-forming toxin [Enterococcus sp. 2CBP]MDU0352145.1 ETX/MTX2 family pore-forming toxin [Enterococcus sp. 3MOLP]